MKRVTLLILFLFIGTMISSGQTYTYTGPGTIPDASCTASHEFPLPSAVAGQGTIGTVDLIDNITINITHTFTGDLDITLIGPGGSPTLELSTDNGGGGDNYTGTVFTDSGASTAVGQSAPFTGNFLPEGGDLNTVFNGVDPNGVWTLQVCDDAGGDLGTVDDWSITFTPVPTSAPDCPLNQMATTDACGDRDTVLSWDASPGATDYFLTIGTTPGGTDVLSTSLIGNVTSYTVTGQTPGQDYYYTLAPVNAFGPNFSCTEQTYTTAATGCLCESVPTSVDNDGITNVRIQTTDYPITPGQSYTDNTAGVVEDLGRAALTNLDITFETGFTYSVNIWIDFNDDLVLDPSEKVFSGLSDPANPTTFDADFTVDAAAALGVHKMRIVTADNDTLDDPCYNGSFGVTVDFDVEIVDLPCTTLEFTPIVVNQDCINGTFTLDFDITNFGTSFAIETDEDANVGGNDSEFWGPFPPATPFSVSFGPFDNGTSVTISDLNGACSLNLGPFTNDLCPPNPPVGVTCTGPGPAVVFTEDFDNVSAGWTGTLNGGNGTWEIPDGTNSGGTGPTTGFSGTNWMQYQASGDATATAVAVSPAIDLSTGAEQAELSFYLHAFGADMGTLDVGVSTTGAGGPFTSVFTWTGEFQTAETDPWVPVGADLTPYLGSTINIQFTHTGTGTGFEGDMSIDLMEVSTCGTFCLDPTALTVSNITATGAEFNWTENGTSTAWEVAIQAPGTGTPAGAGTAAPAIPYIASGLTGNTEYEVYVRAVCDPGVQFSGWFGPVNFTTLCDVIVPDYTADMSSHLPDACWEEAGSGEVIDGPGGVGASDWRLASYTFGPSNAINLWQAVDREWLISPEFDVSGDSYQLELNVALTTFGGGGAGDGSFAGTDDEVQLLVTTDGGTSWTALDTWNAANEPVFTGEENIYDLSSYTGVIQFAIWGSDGTVDDAPDNDFHVGKFIVRVPPSCLEPTGLTVTAVFPTSVDVTWTPDPGNTDFNLFVVPNGDPAPDPGTATPDASITAPTNVAALTTFNGGTPIAPDSSYDIYLVGICGVDSSALVGPASFTTPCLETPDYTEDFATFLDPCWLEATGGDTTTGPTAVGFGGFGPDGFANVGTTGATKINTFGAGPDVDWLISPLIDLSGGGYELLLDAVILDWNSTTTFAGGFNPADRIELVYSEDFGATWTTLYDFVANTPPVPAGETINVDLSALTSPNTFFAIYVEEDPVDSTGRDIDVMFDNFIVRTPPACEPPTGLALSNATNSSVDATWNSSVGNTAFELYVVPTGDPAPAAGGTPDGSTTDPVVTEGLSTFNGGTPMTSATTYDVYLYAECAPGVYSNAVGPVTFTTLPDGPTGVTCTTTPASNTFIFTEEFDAQGLWTGDFGGANGTWGFATGTTPSGGFSPTGPDAPFSGGSYMFYEASGSTTATASAVSPAIDLTTAEDAAELSFNFHAFGGGIGDLVVGIGTSPTGPFTTEFSWSGPLQTAQTDAWTPVGIDLTSYLGSTIYVEFSHTGAGDFEGDMAIDLMRVETCGAFCLDPSSIVVSDISGGSATIGWTQNGSESNWEVYVDVAPAAAPGAANNTGENASTNPYTVTGLAPLTNYQVWVRAECTLDSEFSGWAGPVSFSTVEACPDVSAITVSNITDTEATIGWTNGGGDNEASWEVALVTPPTGTPPVSGTSSPTNPYVAMGLTAETEYEVWVRADCGVDGTSANFVNGGTFTTACAPLPAPYFEDFETFTVTTDFTGENCWNEVSPTAYDWEVDSGATDSTGTGPNAAFSGANYLVVDATDGGSGDTATLASPIVDLTGITVPRLTFYYHMFGPGITQLDVQVSGNGGAFNTELSIVGEQQTAATDPWLLANVDLTAYAGQNVIVQFVTVKDTFEGDVAIDDVTIEETPNCGDPTGITISGLGPDTATFSWTAPTAGTVLSYDWEVQPAGTPQGTPGEVDAENTTLTTGFSVGLTPSTSYDFYIRANCTAGSSSYVGPFNFTTTAPVVDTFPYSEDFDVDAGGWVAGGSWELGTPAGTNINAADTAPNSWVTDLDGTYVASDNSSVVSPPFDMSSLVDPIVQLSVWYDSEFSWDGMKLESSIDGGATWQSVGAVGDPNNWYNDGTVAALGGDQDGWSGTGGSGSGGWLVARNNLTGLGGESSVLLRVRFASDTSVQAGDGGAFDTISIFEAPTCLEVSNIAVSNITGSGADITWDASASGETNWEVAVLPDGTGAPSNADNSGDAATTNSYTASGLAAETAYEVWVRAECTLGSDFGLWVGPVDFTTGCAPVVPNYAADMSSHLPDSCWQEAGSGEVIDGPGGIGASDWRAASYTFGASNAINLWQAVDREWLISPEFDLSVGGPYELQLNVALTTFGGGGAGDGTFAGTDDEVQLLISTDGGASWTALDTWNAANEPVFTGQDENYDLSSYTGIVQFAIWGSDGTVDDAPDNDFHVGRFVVTDNAPVSYTYTAGVWAPSDPNGIATTNDDITIASGDATIASSTSCNSLVINPGASLTVDGGATLTVATTLTCQSTSTSYSSLIRDGNIVGTVNYERHVNINGSGTTGSNDLVSPPVSGQAFDQFAAANTNLFSNGAGTIYLFGPFSKTAGTWQNYASTETAPLTAGVGYRAATDNNSTLTFTGTVENGLISNDISNSGPNNQEWNLVGNPYPSHLNVWDFLLHSVGPTNNLGLFDPPTAAIWGYDGTAQNGWTIYNLATTTPSTVITPGQGFFVSAELGGDNDLADLEFTPAMRRTGNVDDFIVGRNAELTFLKLKLSSNNNAYITEFYFNPLATEGFDLGYDAAHWGDTLPDFSIYSTLVDDDQGDEIVLQALSYAAMGDVTIPLGVEANQGEQIVFSIDDSTLPSTVQVYLDDTVANTSTLLNGSDYVITPTTDLSGTGRFFLRYSDDTLSTVDNSLDMLDIYTLKDSDELVVNGQLLENTTLDLYDIQGRLVLSTELDNELVQNRIDVSSFNAGVYVAIVQNNSQERTKKVIIE